MKASTWLKCFFGILIAVLVITGAFTAWLDPFFHYHAPLQGYYYEIDSERYQNDGIMRHFDYDALITGTSMCENFKASEFDALFGVNSIKVPYSGGSFYEISSSTDTAFKTHKVKYVVRSLDYSLLAMDRYYTDSKYETGFLSNDFIFDDVKYLINKDVLVKYCLKTIQRKVAKEPGGHTSFDEYANWMAEFNENDHPEMQKGVKAGKKTDLDEAGKEKLKGNLEQNIVRQVRENPDTIFYLFFPPYSIASWQDMYVDGRIDRQISLEEETAKILLEFPNIRLFSFNDETEIITDLDNYSDHLHYSEDVNSKILEWMKEEKHMLTKENYREYIEWERSFFNGYDYY